MGRFIEKMNIHWIKEIDKRFEQLRKLIHHSINAEDGIMAKLIRLERLSTKILHLVEQKTDNKDARFISFINEEGTNMSMLNMTDSQQAIVKLAIKDAKGKPAKVDGVPLWAVADSSVATVVPAADGLSANIVAGDGGNTQVTVTADADLGSGVSPIIGLLDVVVEGGPATVVELQPGTPTEQP